MVQPSLSFHHLAAPLYRALLLFLLAAAPARAQHVHVQLSHTPATQWRLFIHDFESGEFDPADVPFLVMHQAFSFVPVNSFTNFLGPAGSSLWRLPETENGDLLYLGIGTSGITPGTFVNNQIRLQLRSLSGPGHFALYNVDPFGAPVVHMNSRDGLDPSVDFLALSSVGGHAHVNWAFSAPGTYRLGFSATGRLAASGQTSTSPVVEYTFIVQDVPWRPRLGAPLRFPGGGFTFTVTGAAGRRCFIWSTTDLQTWRMETNFPMKAPVQTVTLPVQAGREHQCFRASAE